MADLRPAPYTIFCVFVGGSRPFLVKIDKDEPVGELQEEIKKKKPTYFDGIYADEITLFHIELKDEERLADDSRKRLQEVPAPVPMNPLKKLVDYFPNPPPSDTVHIIVELPPKTSSNSIGLAQGNTFGEGLSVIFRALVPAFSNLFAYQRSKVGKALPNHISVREETVKVIYERLDFYRFIQIRGTPASGKTTLAALLINYIRQKEGVEALYIASWPKYDTDWFDQLSAKGWKEEGDILVIDEAQMTYWDKTLWNELFKSIQIGHPHRVILFSSYGSATGESKQNSPCVDVTPYAEMVISPVQLINLRPIDHNDGYGAVGLLLTEAEYREVIGNTLSPIHFEEDLIEYIYSLTSGHPGGIIDLLRTITTHKSYHRLQRNNTDYKYSLGDFHRFINLDELWNGLILGAVFKRGLPTIREMQNPAYATIFRAVLNNQYLEETDLNEEENIALATCVKNGWLFADVIPLDHLLDPLIVAHFFTTQLHRWTIDYYLGPYIEKPLIEEKDLLTFVVAVISRFSPLQLATPQKIGPSFVQRPPEAQFQDEFYRCSHLYSKGSLITFPEYGTAGGRVDFYIPTKKWGVELLRDGDRLEKHTGRFSGRGAYAQTMDLEDYIILDFRTSRLRDKHPGIQGLYHIVFTENYGRLDIFTNKHEHVQAVVLLNAGPVPL